MRALVGLRAERVHATNPCIHHVSSHCYAQLRSGRISGATEPLSVASHREQRFLASTVKTVRPLRQPAALLSTPDEAIRTYFTSRPIDSGPYYNDVPCFTSIHDPEDHVAQGTRERCVENPRLRTRRMKGMEFLLNYIAPAIGLVASVLSILQFLLSRDQRQQIKELERRNSYLSGKVADMVAGITTDITESKEALNHDLPRLQFKHLAHSFDQLRRRIILGVIVFSGISYAIVLSIVGEDYAFAIIVHALAVIPVSILMHISIRYFTLRKLRSLYVASSYQGDKDLTELQSWIGTQPWKKKIYRHHLNQCGNEMVIE